MVSPASQAPAFRPPSEPLAPTGPWAFVTFGEWFSTRGRAPVATARKCLAFPRPCQSELPRNLSGPARLRPTLGSFPTPSPQHRRTAPGTLPTSSPTSSDRPGKPSYPLRNIVRPPRKAFVGTANIRGGARSQTRLYGIVRHKCADWPPLRGMLQYLAGLRHAFVCSSR